MITRAIRIKRKYISHIDDCSHLHSLHVPLNLNMISAPHPNQQAIPTYQQIKQINKYNTYYIIYTHQKTLSKKIN